MLKNIIKCSLTLMLTTGIVSCMQVSPSNQSKVPGVQSAKVAKGAEIQLSIKQPLTTKASVNGTLPKSIEDIHSFSAFLTTTPGAPSLAGSNPAGDGVMFNVDRNSETPLTVITFVNVPPGGPYYAVVGAFENNDAGERVNITEPNPFISDESNKWAVSSNSVTVNSDLSLTFNPGDDSVSTTEITQLDVFLQLQHGTPPQVDTSITPVNGNTDSSPFEAY